MFRLCWACFCQLVHSLIYFHCRIAYDFMLLCSVPSEFSRNVILKANIPGWMWLLSGMSVLCSKTLQVLTALAGSPQRGGLGAKADRTLSLFVSLYRFSVLAWSDQENGPWCLKGTCLLIALGPVLALLPQKPEIHSLVLIPTAGASPCPFLSRDTVCWLHILPRGQQAGRTEP